MTKTCISRTNFINYILHCAGDVQFCKTSMGDLVIRVWENGKARIISEHGKDYVGAWNTFAQIVKPGNTVMISD